MREKEILFLIVNKNLKIINESQKTLSGCSMGDFFCSVLDLRGPWAGINPLDMQHILKK